MSIALRFATAADVPQILRFIRGLGEYENLSAEVVATEESLTATLFGERRYAEVVLADCDGKSEWNTYRLTGEPLRRLAG